MKLKRFIVAGFAGGLVILIASMVFQMAVQAVWPFNIFELGGMRAQDDPVMMLFFLHPWVLSFCMTAVYAKLGSSLQGNKLWKGNKFGFLMWLVAGLPSAFIVYSSMNYPIGFSVNSLFGSLVYMMLAGVAIAVIME